MIELNRLGNIYGNDKGTGFAGNVWDKNGLAPTINTAQGGNRMPLIIDDTYANREPRVYDTYAPSLRSERSGLKVVDAIPAAMRGRYNENNIVKQNLEIHNDGISNCITSVEKDSLVIEKYDG